MFDLLYIIVNDNTFKEKFVDLGMGRHARSLSKTQIHQAANAVIQGIKEKYSPRVDDCIDYVVQNQEKVSDAYFVAASMGNRHVSEQDRTVGYEAILQRLGETQARLDNSFVTNSYEKKARRW